MSHVDCIGIANRLRAERHDCYAVWCFFSRLNYALKRSCSFVRICCNTGMYILSEVKWFYRYHFLFSRCPQSTWLRAMRHSSTFHHIDTISSSSTWCYAIHQTSKASIGGRNAKCSAVRWRCWHSKLNGSWYLFSFLYRISLTLAHGEFGSK